MGEPFKGLGGRQGEELEGALKGFIYIAFEYGDRLDVGGL